MLTTRSRFLHQSTSRLQSSISTNRKNREGRPTNPHNQALRASGRRRRLEINVTRARRVNLDVRLKVRAAVKREFYYQDDRSNKFWTRVRSVKSGREWEFDRRSMIATILRSKLVKSPILDKPLFRSVRSN